jgi:hypothetical protein
MAKLFNIAVCLSGQARTWKTASDNILNYFNTKICIERNMRVRVDYFIHTWDTNSYRDKTEPRWQNKDYKIINPLEEEDMRLTFLPADMEYEVYDSTKHLHAWSGLFYSFMKSVNLKRKYELENDITYDMVVKSRLDINFPQEGINKYGEPISKFHPHMLRPLTAYPSSPTPTRFPTEFNQSCFDDVFYYADSPTMDLISNIYFWYKDIMDKGLAQRQRKEFVSNPEYYYGPGTLLYKYITNWNIHPYADHANPYYVVRKIAQEKGLHSINDWKQIQELHFDWYENGYGKEQTELIEKLVNEGMPVNILKSSRVI